MEVDAMATPSRAVLELPVLGVGSYRDRCPTGDPDGRVDVDSMRTRAFPWGRSCPIAALDDGIDREPAKPLPALLGAVGLEPVLTVGSIEGTDTDGTSE